MKVTTYRCIGEVRGWCGHDHILPVAAVECLNADREGCKSQGGYSDRIIVIYQDGLPVAERRRE